MRRGSGAGRRLLATRNRIRNEEDPSLRRKLMRREVRLLVELGNLDEAGRAASALTGEFPEWPPGYAILADLACHGGNWDEAEGLFDRSAELHLREGDVASATRLMTGPLYRLAEARGDCRRCLELSSGDGELQRVLAFRAGRMSGLRQESMPEEPRGWLECRLYILEKAWRGASPRKLLETAGEWGGTEPEWRWRFLVEGIELWNRKGLDTGQWKSCIMETSRPVLDPRFHEEWRNIGI